MEYKWTKNEIVVTTINIKAVTESKRKPQVISKTSIFNQVKRFKRIKLFETPNSKNENQDNKVVRNIREKAIIAEPWRPKNLPNRLNKKKESKGKYKTNKYILFN